MNKVELIGRVTKDIETQITVGGKVYARFTLAVNRQRKDDGADFPSVTAWGRTAENMRLYVHKGDRVAVVGRLKTSSYDKDGHTVYSTEVMADEVEFLEYKNRSAAAAGGDATPATDENGFTDVDPDDIPFG